MCKTDRDTTHMYLKRAVDTIMMSGATNASNDDSNKRKLEEEEPSDSQQDSKVCKTSSNSPTLEDEDAERLKRFEKCTIEGFVQMSKGAQALGADVDRMTCQEAWKTLLMSDNKTSVRAVFDGMIGANVRPDEEPEDPAQRVEARNFVKIIVAFNSPTRWGDGEDEISPGYEVVWQTDESPPEGVVPMAIAFDISGSMHRHHNEARAALAAFVENSNVPDDIEIDEPGGMTAMVHCIQKHRASFENTDLVIITDGKENIYNGQLQISSDISVQMNQSDCNTDSYIEAVSKYLVNVTKANIYLVGLGGETQRTARAMINHDNVYCVLANKGDDMRNIHGAIEVVTAEARSVRRARRSGKEVTERVAYRKIIRTDSAVAQERAKRISEQRINRLQSNASKVRIRGCNAPAREKPAPPAPPPIVPFTPDEILQQLSEHFETVIKSYTQTEDECKLLKTAMLYFLQSCFYKNEQGEVVKQSVPGAAITGKKYNGLFKMNEHANSAKILNQVFYNMYSSTDNKLLEKGASIAQGTPSHFKLACNIEESFSMSCPTYKLVERATPDVINQVVAKAFADDWCNSYVKLFEVFGREKISLDQIKRNLPSCMVVEDPASASASASAAM